MMFSLLKEIGRGKRGSRDLNYEEASLGAEWILTGKASPVQIGAFLLAERMKMESVDEITAFVDTCRSFSRLHPIEGALDCAGPYDGRTRTFYASLPAAFVLCANDVPVTMHSSATLPPKRGITLIDIFRQWGISGERTDPDRLIRAAEKSGFLFVPTEQWCPPLSRIRSMREEIGMRTIFNTVEKLIRFSDAPFVVFGIYHGTVFEKIAGLFRRAGIERGLIVQGMEGSEDLSVEKRTRAYLVQGEQAEWHVIDPELLELQSDYEDAAWTAERQAESIVSVLAGRAGLAEYNTVLLNSAVRMWLCGKASSVEEGIYKAKFSLDSGLALERFDTWKRSVLEN